MRGLKRMSMFRFAVRCGLVWSMATLGGVGAWAQAPAAASTSAGPGRITCSSATSCELGVGTPASIRYKIDPSALPDADKTRLTKQCTAKAPPCVATVDGTETKAVIKASKIKFYN
jgi:hypothetical protein